MSALVWIVVWLFALLGGVAVVFVTRVEERRWATVASLLLGMLGAGGLGITTSWGTHPITIGPFHVDAVPTTVAPAMLLGALALVLMAGRAEASSRESGWLLGMIAAESVALLSGSFALLLMAEATATGVLAVHAKRRGHRAHFMYLGFATLVLAVAGILHEVGGTSMQPIVAGLTLFGALLRLGIFPLSTGMLASLQHRPTTATLIATLPFGGVLLLIRVNPMLAEIGSISPLVIKLLLLSAPVAAALAIRQTGLGRSLGYTLAATHALIALGALDPSTSGQLGGELLWAGALLTATGFGAAANLVALRIGDPDLNHHHGLHASAPFLSLAFLVLGVGLAGAPGTVEFVAEDILLNTASAEGTLGMAMVVSTIALIGYNVLRLQFRIFFGASPAERPYLRTKSRERLGLVLVGGAVVLGGITPSLLPLVTAAAGH